MRVRINFTIEINCDQYCEALEADMTKTEIRERIQNECRQDLMITLADKNVEANMLGVNNVYDPSQRLTVAEHLVRS